MPVKVSLNKKAVLISDDKELYSSFKRAFKTIAKFELVRYSGEFKRKQNVAISTKEDNDIDLWLWREFRTKHKTLNPLIVIGMGNKSSFIGNNPVFGDYSEEHRGGRVSLDRQKRIISDKLPVHAAACFCGRVLQ